MYNGCTAGYIWTCQVESAKMEMSTGTIGAVGYGFGYVFTLWPLFVLSPLKWKKENILASMIIVWTLMLFGWLFARTVSPRPLAVLIPEPLNTGLFFLTGLALLLWALLRAMREQRFARTMVRAELNASGQLDISSAQLQKMTLELYRSLGYKVERKAGSRRHGAEVLVRGVNGKKWLVHCRDWGGPAGEDAVQEFSASLEQSGVDGGILITCGTFSRAARDWANGRPISLMEGHEFLSAWRQAVGA
jgi:HJR/Mrr/RecB family endonuclease